MITSIQQAKKVQERRQLEGKKGYAKAVRRFLLRDHKDEYRKVKSNLPVSWPYQNNAA